jgi:hypothetical protein
MTEILIAGGVLLYVVFVGFALVLCRIAAISDQEMRP